MKKKISVNIYKKNKKLVNMIDTHIHADSRSSEDFEKMYAEGINTAITCAFYPYIINNESILLNHLEKILYYDTKRVERYNIDLKVALGIHPANCLSNPEIIFENMYKWIENKEIVAIGEIGLETGSNEEIEIFKKQLEIANETKTKAIVHTPRKNKAEILEKILEIIPIICDEKLIVIDHINLEVVSKVIDSDYTLGLTVQPQKMTSQEAITILEEYGFDKFLLNSDMSYKPSDPLSVPKTVKELKNKNFEDKKIEKIAFKNANSFFNLF